MPRPPLVRTSGDKVVSGLCGGLGRHFGVDPVVFRVAFVVLALAGGSGLFLYAAGWLLVPDDRTGVSLVHAWFGGSTPAKFVGALVVGAGLLMLLDGLDDFGGFGVGVVLIGVGIAVLLGRRPPSGTAPPGDLATTPAPPAAPPPPAPPPTIVNPPPPTPVRHRSVLPGVTLSLLAILAGALVPLDAAGALDVSIETGLALALVLVGGAMVVGARWGRALWLIPIGLLLSIALVVVGVAGLPFHGGVGERTHRPASAAQLQSPYRLAAGELTVDLRRVDVTGTRAVVASVGAGELRIVLPPEVTVSLDAHVGAGELTVQGQTWEGLDVNRESRLAGAAPESRIRLNARVGFGTLEVIRAPA
ncbi:MAG: PspC domain-containing protein [Actinomycetota bacterium]|nr:PspC domain-containing protein [Actinomycetota bacterium]